MKKNTKYDFHWETNCWKKLYIKNCNFQAFLIKGVLQRAYVNKGCNFQNPFLITVLLSIPCNKLPCVLVEMVSTRSTTPDTKERETIRLKLPIAACIVLTWLLGLHILTGFLLFDVFLFSFFSQVGRDQTGFSSNL